MQDLHMSLAVQLMFSNDGTVGQICDVNSSTIYKAGSAINSPNVPGRRDQPDPLVICDVRNGDVTTVI